MESKSVWRGNFLFFVAFFLYWVLLSWLDRGVFLFRVRHRVEDFGDVGYTFLYGLKLDCSLAAYLLVLPFLFFIVQHLWIRRPVSPWILRAYILLHTFFFTAITAANLPLYEAWGEKISKRAILLGFGTMSGVSNSVDPGMLWQGAWVFVLFFAAAHFFYIGVILKYAKYRPQKRTVSGWTFVLGLFVLFSVIRGGYGRTPINQSSVYFSDDNIMNHAAVNTYWSFLEDCSKIPGKNPYAFMPQEEADRLLDEALSSTGDSVLRVLKTDRPNVILLVLEGVVAQVFEDLGGESGVTPMMGRLMDEGISFRRAYAAAERSDKGMIALLSGFPAQGTESIIQYIPKHERLPGVGQLFDSLGYSTSFYHGGQSELYNFKSYMLTHGIDRIVDNSDFPIGAQRNSWGVYDHLVAARMLTDLNGDDKPFFSAFFALVSHEPFHLSPSYKFGKDTKANAYRSTCFYTDTMLYNFIEQAKKQDWYDSTVVVVTSDHGHIYPTEKYGLERPERYHVPLFLFGGALKEEFRGLKVDEPASQVDIAGTLAGFVGHGCRAFSYSNDLFALGRKKTAFFNSNSAFGIVAGEHVVSYDMLKRDVGYSTVPKDRPETRDSLIHVAKAYYQTVFRDFLAY